MAKKAVKRKVARKVKKDTTPLFPSRYKLGQRVMLDFFLSGAIAGYCTISGIIFREGKIYYDVDILVRGETTDETFNAIYTTKEQWVTLREVDSVCVEEIKLKKK